MRLPMAPQRDNLGGVASARRLGGIPAVFDRLRVQPASPESAQLARVHGVLASWQAGVTPGCGCLKCLILRIASAELADAMGDVSDPLYAGVCLAAVPAEGAGDGIR